MLSLHTLSLHKSSSLSLSHLSCFTIKPKTPTSQLLLLGGGGSSDNWIIVHAVKKDSEQFEIDPDEARAALQKLDQQLQTLSKKQVKPPKIKAKDVKLTGDQTGEEVPEISGSFLTTSAFLLLLFSILYNVLFYAVIKPSIDGPDDPFEAAPASTMATKSPNAAVLQSLLLLPKYFVQR